MPEVGVLNLTIHDNSKTAADGLNQLADALGRIQGALGNGLRLSGVSKPLNTFAKAVGDNSKSLANVGTFMNAVSSYAKAFDEAGKVKFNAQPIKDLKEAIGDGIKIGQAGTQITKIREALGGEWNVDNAYKAGMAMSAIGEGAKSIPSGLEKKANGVKALAEALNEYANVMERIKTVTGSSSFNGNEMFSATTAPVEQAKKDLVDYQQVVDRMKDIQEETKVSFREPLLKLNLQLHGRKGIPGDYGMDMDAMSRMTSSDSSDFVKIEETIHSATDAAGEFKVRLEEIGNTVTSIRYNPFEEMYQSFSKLSGELGWFKKEGMRLMAGPDIHRSVSNGNMLSTQVGQLFTKEIYDSWKPNFVMDDSWMNNMYQRMVDMYNEFGWFKNSMPALPAGQSMLGLPAGNAIEANVFTDAQGDIHAVVEETKEAVRATQQYIDLSKARAVHERDAAKYASKDWTFEDVYNGTREKAMGKRSLVSEWLHGNGTENEQMAAIKQVAQQFKMTVDEVKQKIAELNSMGSSSNAVQFDNLINMGQADLLSMKMHGMEEALRNDIQTGRLSQQEMAERVMAINRVKDAISKLNEAQEEATASVGRSGSGWKTLGASMKAMFPTISGLIGRFKQLIKYRILRSIIRHIASGFSEGMQNVYEYSKLVGTSFAPAMDSAATAVQQMKNSFGAALAPAVQALIPLLQTVVNWVITAVNWVNQLFALLGGQKTWTRALPATTEAFNKQKKAAKGAGAAIKDLLADWDELNIIQSQTGGGGGGATTPAEDYLKMFEEVGEFNNTIKDIVGFIQEHMDDVLNIIKEAGLALLGWRFSNAFTGILGGLGGLITEGIIIKLSADVTSLLDEAYVKSDNEAFLVADVVMNGALAGVAAKLADAKFGEGAGSIAAGIVLAVSAGATFTTAAEAFEAGRQAQSDTLKIVGGVKTAIAGVLATAGFIKRGVPLPLAIIGGIATVAVATAISFSLTYSAHKHASELEMAEEAFKSKTKGGLDPTAYIEALQTKFDDITKDTSLVLDANVDFSALEVKVHDAMKTINSLTEIVNGEGHLTKDQAKEFSESWGIVLNTLDEMSHKSYNTILAGLNESLATAVGETKKRIEELRTEFIQITHNVDEQTAEVYKEMQEIVARIGANKYKSEADKLADIEQYNKLASAIAIMTDTTYDELHNAIRKSQGIDFSKTGLEGATEWIEDVSAKAKEALSQTDSAMEAYESSIGFERKRYAMLLEAGKITPEFAEAANKNLDQMVEEYRKTIEAKKKKINDEMNEAFSEALRGAFSGGITNEEWKHVLKPLIIKMKEAGGEVPEFAVNAIREGMSSSFYDGTSGLTPEWFYSLFRNSGSFGAKFSVNEVMERIIGRVNQNVQEGNGPTWLLDIIKETGLSGIDLLDENWKQDILAYARSAGLDQSFINDLMTALGLKEDLGHVIEDPLKKAQKEVKSATAEMLKDLSEQDFIPDKKIEEEYKNPWGWLADPLGVSFTPPEIEKIDTTEYDEGLKDVVETTSESVEELEALYAELKKTIAFSDASPLDKLSGYSKAAELYTQGQINQLQTLIDYINSFGVGEGIRMFDEYGEGFGKMQLPSKRLVASMPSVSDVGWTPRTEPVATTPVETIKTEPKDNQQDAANVASGVRAGNSDVVSELRSVVMQLQRLLAKEWTVNVTPSADWGRNNSRSNEEYAKAWGD